MTELKAKPVVKNKFWIVERSGEKIATIQAVEDGGFVYVHDDQRDLYDTVRSLKTKLNITFDRPQKTALGISSEVYGFPAGSKTYNCLYDVSRKLPIYTKTAKSKSYFCAGFYAIKFNNTWTRAYCPKLITLQRYEFLGPYETKQDLDQAIEETNGK